MELFVINRHGNEESGVTEEEEKAKLEKVLRQIERKKQQRIRQRERQKQQKSQKSVDFTGSKKPKYEDNQDSKLSTTQQDPSEEQQNDSSINNTSKLPQKPPDLKNFTILGTDTTFKKNKAERVLPQWLANPTVISSNLQDLSVKVSKLKQLDKSLRTQLKLNGIKYLFPVQAEVIPNLLQMQNHSDVMIPRDICVSAPTGSGKTLAFVLPVVQALKRHTVRKIRALVILPTQDLAEQVFKTFKTYTQGTNIESGLVSGKHLFTSEQRQLLYHNEAFGYVSKIDILVCTAGRLVSHLKQTKGFDLTSLEFLIIDEADRVLESVQDDWLYHLEKHISQNNSSVHTRKILNLASLQKQRTPQKLLFSATLTQDPEKIEKLSLFQPKLFSCVTEDSETVEESGTFKGKYTTPEELTEKYIVCSKDLKPLVLYQFIEQENLTKTLIFTHSVESAHRLKILLQSLFESKLKIEEISSGLTGTNRDSFIAKFSKGDVDLLICTDSLARGIDLPGVQCVISYSAPKYVKTYIHRAGRTARAGESGLAVTLLHTEQLSSFKTMLAQVKKTDVNELQISEEDLESLGKLYKNALKKLKETVDKEEKIGMKNRIFKKKCLQIEKKKKS